MRTTRELLLEAIEIIETDREAEHESFAVNGVVTDQDAIDTIAEYDSWLHDARAVTAAGRVQ